MKYKIAAVFFLLAIVMHAQQFELGKVSKAELEEKTHPADSTAPAAILYQKGNIYFNYVGFWVVVTEVETRIKIYTKEGYEYAQEKLNYRSGNAAGNLFSDAYTYNLQGGEIVKTKLGPEGEFIEAKSKYTETKKIVLPNVKEGSVIEFKYTKFSSSISYLPECHFAYNIPANFIQYNVALPAYFDYHSVVSGNLDIKSTPIEKGKRDGFQENRITYSATDIPALKIEPYIDNIDNYRPLVRHVLAAKKNFVGEKSDYATSWEALAKSVYEDEDFGKQLTYESYFKKDIDAIVNPVMSKEEKMSVIFKYVQNRMLWDEYVGITCSDGVKKAYAGKKGNVAEINLMLIAMLRYAGLEADPVLTSTISNGIAAYPGFSTFNYIVAGVRIENKFILLDATSKYTIPGLLQPLTLNHSGRKIKPDGSAIEIDLTPIVGYKATHAIIAGIDEKGIVTGKVRNQYFDYEAQALRESRLLQKEDDYKAAVEKILGGLEISDYILKNTNNPGLALIEEYSFTDRNIIDISGNKIIFNPMLFLAEKENPFTADLRIYPINFTCPLHKKIMINLTIPQGYIIESLPSAISVVVGDNVVDFKYSIESKDNILQLSVIFNVNKTIIDAENYITVKDFYRKIIEKQNEKIVLRKA